MKKLFKIWMYICTTICTLYILLTGALLIWATIRASDGTYTTKSGKTIDLAAMRRTDPAINELFRAVETKDFETIYRYAAPEIKQEVSYDLFVQDQWPKTITEDIKVLFTESSHTDGSDSEYILLVLSFKENGSERYGSMRWEKSSNSIHFDTFPFRVSLLSEFSSFPKHMTK